MVLENRKSHLPLFILNRLIMLHVGTLFQITTVVRSEFDVDFKYGAYLEMRCLSASNDQRRNEKNWLSISHFFVVFKLFPKKYLISFANGIFFLNYLNGPKQPFPKQTQLESRTYSHVSKVNININFRMW